METKTREKQTKRNRDILMKKSYPCKDCNNRSAGCHDSCDAYKAVKYENNQLTMWLQHENATRLTPSVRKYCKSSGKYEIPPAGVNQK